MKKKILLGLAAVLVVLLTAAGAMATAFLGLKPATDGASLPGGATLVRDGFVNAFILPAGEGQAALVDCGQDPNATALKAQLEKQHLTVTTIFLTHGHGDHIGGCLAFPQAQVFALETERGLAEGAASPHGPVTRFTTGDPAKSPRLSRGLVDGETVTVGTLQVHVYAIPGHTSGSAAYLAGGVLYLGDSLAGQSDGKVRIAPWMFSDDLALCRSSITALAKRVSDEKIETLAFAHSGPLQGVRPLLDFQ